MKFSDILGHENVKERLRAMVDDDRLPHALLLQGPAGVGKFAMARALTQYIHCENRHNGDSCGHCPACVQQQSFNHIDTIFSFPVIKGKNREATSDDYITDWKDFLRENPYMDFSRWLAALGNANAQPVMYVEESAALIHKLNFTAHKARYKTVVMWLPERMNSECANKLLKLVEEPYADTVFIMVSNTPQDILPTIYSRTQRIEMKRMPDDTVASYLIDNMGVDPTDAMAVAHLSEGSLIEAMRQVSLGNQQRESLELFMRLMREAYKRDIRALRQWSVDVSALGREGEIAFLTYCERMVRENFIYNLHTQALNYLNRDEAGFSSKFARFITERNVVKLIDELDSAITDIAGNANAKMVLFDLAIKVIMLIKA